jgi:4-amino-4-deoxy-L-arabinose transferase-like glycosyltransferase
MNTDFHSTITGRLPEPGRLFQGILIVLLGLSIFLPRVLKLDHFVTPDENLWLARSANFYLGIARSNFEMTYQRQHPGVTVMWAGTAGFLWRYPEFRGSGVEQVTPFTLEHYLPTQDWPVTMIELLAAGRFFMVLGSSIALLFAFFLAKKLFGFWPVWVGMILIALDPFQIGNTRLLHLDGLLGNLMLFSLLGFLVYRLERKPIYLFLSAIGAGLSWLTKSPGFFLIPVIGLLAIYDLVTLRRRNGTIKWNIGLAHSIGPALIWGILGLAVFVTLFPAMWRIPEDIIRAIVVRALDYAQEGHDVAIFFNGIVFPDGNVGWEYWYFYPLTYLWRSTPLTLLGLVLAIIGLPGIRRYLPGKAAENLAGISLMVLVFTLVMTMGGKKFDRYLLPVYPLLGLISGVGWVLLLANLRERWKFTRSAGFTFLLLGVVLGLQLTAVIRTYPYYLTYYNPLLGGSQRAREVMQIGWGEGLDQAARYLNSKPNARDLVVFSWYGQGPFSYFFEGSYRVIHSNFNDEMELWKDFVSADYALIYVHQLQRRVPADALDYLGPHEPEHIIYLEGIEYVWIYDLKEIRSRMTAQSSQKLFLFQ